MPDLVREVVGRLRVAGVTLDSGLTDDEIAGIEDVFGFVFGAEHRALLTTALPVGGSWVDWRRGSCGVLQQRLDWPVDGVVFDVGNNGFWPASWGRRPAEGAAAEVKSRERMAQVPKLVPLYSYRYVPADPAPVPSPVFSVNQTDVIYYGDTLLDYVAHEFTTPPRYPAAPSQRPHVRFWSDLADGAEDTDL